MGEANIPESRARSQNELGKVGKIRHSSVRQSTEPGCAQLSAQKQRKSSPSTQKGLGATTQPASSGSVEGNQEWQGGSSPEIQPAESNPRSVGPANTAHREGLEEPRLCRTGGWGETEQRSWVRGLNHSEEAPGQALEKSYPTAMCCQWQCHPDSHRCLNLTNICMFANKALLCWKTALTASTLCHAQGRSCLKHAPNVAFLSQARS